MQRTIGRIAGDRQNSQRVDCTSSVHCGAVDNVTSTSLVRNHYQAQGSQTLSDSHAHPTNMMADPAQRLKLCRAVIQVGMRSGFLTIVCDHHHMWVFRGVGQLYHQTCLYEHDHCQVSNDTTQELTRARERSDATLPFPVFVRIVQPLDGGSHCSNVPRDLLQP